MADKPKLTTTFPLSKKFNIHFSPFEDRLVVRAQRSDKSEVHMLLTRRMVILVLKQLLDKLPELTGLEKTPAVYWQEVLQMAHQEAMQAKAEADRARAENLEQKQAAAGESASTPVPSDEQSAAFDATLPAPESLYLAIELTTQVSGEQLTLAFKGLPMPDAMVKSSQTVPVFAVPLQVENVHQLVELLIGKCQEAQWHLPLELPWLDAPEAGDMGGGNKKYSLLHH